MLCKTQGDIKQEQIKYKQWLTAEQKQASTQAIAPKHHLLHLKDHVVAAIQSCQWEGVGSVRSILPATDNRLSKLLLVACW
eukprot:m.94849 g.94849  ORF g.94849 m.94849 type:complete len:81 (-) comp15005_c0_seq9:2264-2506(-)